MSRRTTLSTVLAITALAAPAGASAMPNDPVDTGSIGVPAPQVEPAAPIVDGATDGTLIAILAGSTLVAAAAGFGSGRLITRRALLPH